MARAPKKGRKRKGWYPKKLGRHRDSAVRLAEGWIEMMGGDREKSDPGTSFDAVQEAGMVLFGGRKPTYAMLSQALSTMPGHSGLSRADYEAEVSNLALAAHRLIRWVNFGMPTYILDPDTAGMLSLIDVERIKQSDIHFPFPTLLIILEPGSPLYMDDKGHTREVRYIWVNHYEDRKNNAWLRITPAVDLDAVSLPVPLRYESGRNVSAWLKEGPRQQWGTERMTELDKAAIQAAIRLVVSFVLHLTAHKPSPARAPSIKSEPRLARQDLPLPTDWVVARIKMPAQIKAAIKEQGPKVQGKLMLRQVVAGHYRRVVHGVGRALRLWQRIDPYWRGEGPEAAVREVVAPKRRPKKKRTDNPAERRRRLRRLLRI
jgi:hypothetical protein